MDKPQDAVTLVDVLIDGFEKNEIIDGFHWRNLPMPDEESALRRFTSLFAEARQWKGDPAREVAEPTRRLVAWTDLEIRQSGRGILVRVVAPRFDRWWHDRETWDGDPMKPLFEWLSEDE